MKIKTNEMIELATIAAGATFSTTILGYVKGVVPQLGIGDDLLSIGLGYAINEYFKNKHIKNIGKGIFVAGVSQLLATYVPNAAGSIHYPHGKEPQKTPQSVIDTANQIAKNDFGL